jgi:hypothetical protein
LCRLPCAASLAAGDAVLIDVMDNDLGGAAKHLLSVNQLHPTVAATSAASALGPMVSIVGDQISYAPTGAYFQSLSLGQKVVDTFTHTIQMGNGATSTATVSVTVIATEDGVTVRLDAL